MRPAMRTPMRPQAATASAVDDRTSAESALRAGGLRMTRQRRAIVEAMQQPGDHRTAQQLLEAVRTAHPRTNASTVYRTLATLRDAGLVTETDLGGGELRYAWRGRDRHHHMICRQCGAVFELDHAYLEPLEAALDRDHHFRAALDHFAIWGDCAACRRARA